ncbi:MULTISPECIES: SMP-30/gluconolactonase/LRE family protein [unclassified Oleiphilus]|nr:MULTISPECIES: L-dopachrome tautomerase-related protein [unclassified Oleiphilus]
MLKALTTLLFAVVLIIGLGAAALDGFYGGGDAFPDRSGQPLLPAEALIKVADLPYPPGNIAVSKNERIFFTYHPEGFPPYNIAELVDGEAKPFEFESPAGLNLSTVLSMRLDRQGRLWLLDYGDHGQETPQILAVDIESREVVHHHRFSSDIAGLGSHMNDFQVSHDGTRIYIANASIIGLSPSIIVYDVIEQRARIAIEDHDSVDPDYYVPHVEGVKMLMFGVFAIRPGVDSIALDRNEEWLYFAPVTDEKMWRVRVSDLNNPALSAEALKTKIEAFGEKTMSDGITIDDEDTLYISDLEHSAIIQMRSDGSIQTLYKDKKLRWPDGFSFGPNGWLYVTASALQSVIAKPDQYIQEKGPYQIFKLKTDTTAYPGH